MAKWLITGNSIVNAEHIDSIVVMSPYLGWGGGNLIRVNITMSGNRNTYPYDFGTIDPIKIKSISQKDTECIIERFKDALYNFIAFSDSLLDLTELSEEIIHKVLPDIGTPGTPVKEESEPDSEHTDTQNGDVVFKIQISQNEIADLVDALEEEYPDAPVDLRELVITYLKAYAHDLVDMHRDDVFEQVSERLFQIEEDKE